MDESIFQQIIAAAKDYKAKQQSEIVRYLVSTAYSFGYKAGVKAGHTAADLQQKQQVDYGTK